MINILSTKEIELNTGANEVEDSYWKPQLSNKNKQFVAIWRPIFKLKTSWRAKSCESWCG